MWGEGGDGIMRKDWQCKNWRVSNMLVGGDLEDAALGN